jgi:hypothetical protein
MEKEPVQLLDGTIEWSNGDIAFQLERGEKE